MTTTPLIAALDTGTRSLAQIYQASLGPYEMAVRMRKYYRIGHHYWTLIPPAPDRSAEATR
jgi:hypothetical protein